VVFSLGWTPAEGFSDVDLDASVIAFDANARKLAIVWYMHTNEFHGALQHSGDDRKGGTGDAEQILVDLVRLPVHVAALVFTINSFRKQTFTDVANAYCAVRDIDTGEQLVRFDLSDTQPSTAVLMAELRRSEQPGTWRVRALGEFHDYRTVKKLVPAAARQVRIGG
jgi:stress response protein SCP2